MQKTKLKIVEQARPQHNNKAQTREKKDACRGGRQTGKVRWCCRMQTWFSSRIRKQVLTRNKPTTSPPSSFDARSVPSPPPSIMAGPFGHAECFPSPARALGCAPRRMRLSVLSVPILPETGLVASNVRQCAHRRRFSLPLSTRSSVPSASLGGLVARLGLAGPTGSTGLADCQTESQQVQAQDQKSRRPRRARCTHVPTRPSFPSFPATVRARAHHGNAHWTRQQTACHAPPRPSAIPTDPISRLAPLNRCRTYTTGCCLLLFTCIAVIRCFILPLGYHEGRKAAHTRPSIYRQAFCRHLCQSH